VPPPPASPALKIVSHDQPWKITIPQKQHFSLGRRSALRTCPPTGFRKKKGKMEMEHLKTKNPKQLPTRHEIMNEAHINKSILTDAPAKPAEMDDRLVSAVELLRVIWTDDSRPSLRWLRQQQSRQSIPYLKIGARVWFRPSEVRRYFDAVWTSQRRRTRS
jgi:hypothetical protein